MICLLSTKKKDEGFYFFAFYFVSLPKMLNQESLKMLVTWASSDVAMQGRRLCEPKHGAHLLLLLTCCLQVRDLSCGSDLTQPSNSKWVTEGFDWLGLVNV